VLVVVASLAIVGAVAWATGVARRGPNLPTAVVTRGDFVDIVELRGEIRPVRSVVLSAPAQAGELQIIRLVKNGTAVKPGDVVVEFDSTALRRSELDRRADLKQRDAEIERERAQARITEEAGATSLMKARFDVERAKLDVVDKDFVARLDYERAKLALDDAEQRLREVEKRLLADRAAAEARVAARVRRRDRTQQELDRVVNVLASLEIRAPAAGTASIMQNARFGGMSGGPQEFREGDRAWPGAGIVELPDLSAIRLTTRLEETDRGRVAVGQTGTVHLDAVPDRDYRATVSVISLLARVDFGGSFPPARDFSLELAMADPDTRLKPGMSATVRVAVNRLTSVLVVPAEAVALVGGRPTVYRQAGSRFDARPVAVIRRGREQVALASGVSEGDRVALRPPTPAGSQGRR
jgi:multidrug efflux pump subunit AcrA (membrane-fusion protein)